jgi:hypothetical protein
MAPASQVLSHWVHGNLRDEVELGRQEIAAHGNVGAAELPVRYGIGAL